MASSVHPTHEAVAEQTAAASRFSRSEVESRTSEWPGRFDLLLTRHRLGHVEGVVVNAAVGVECCGEGDIHARRDLLDA